MDDRWSALVAAALILALGGCSHPVQPAVLAVGTCVVSDDSGTKPVACGEAHTHKLVAIAARPEECPPETDLFSQPADPDAGTTTQCFKVNTAAR